MSLYFKKKKKTCAGIPDQLRHDEERVREDLDRVAALFREGVGRISGRFWEVFVL